MSKLLLVVNNDTDLSVYRNAVSIALSALTTSDKAASFGDGRFRSVDIDKGEIGSVSLNAYNAGTAQAATVTLSAAAADGYFSIGLILTTIGVQSTPRKVFYSKTIADLIAQINAEGTKAAGFFYGFTASAASTVVTVTAPLNSTFRLYSPSGGTIAYTQAAVPTTGRDIDVQKLEAYCLPYQGPQNKVGFPVIAPASKVASGATYDMIVSEVYPVANAKDHRGRKSERISLYIAVNKAVVTTAKTAADILAGLVKLS